MKRFSVLLIALVLFACGPSAEQQKETAYMQALNAWYGRLVALQSTLQQQAGSDQIKALLAENSSILSTLPPTPSDPKAGLKAAKANGSLMAAHSAFKGASEALQRYRDLEDNAKKNGGNFLKMQTDQFEQYREWMSKGNAALDEYRSSIGT